MKRLPGLGAGLVVVAAVSACRHEEPIRKPPTPVRVEPVRVHSEMEGVRYSATIEPDELVVLSFKIGGYVDSLLRQRGADGMLRPVQQGDRVRRGTVLARLRTEDYEARSRQARAGQAEAAAGLAKAQADFDRAEALFAAKSLTRPEFDGARA